MPNYKITSEMYDAVITQIHADDEAKAKEEFTNWDWIPTIQRAEQLGDDTRTTAIAKERLTSVSLTVGDPDVFSV